ncbi:Type II Secretion system PilC [Candidatus Thioglobus autotrophicus]|uniref:Type II Secretion system PilC n=1 Tax=Candidatus Thioglobus autotrophicus TaxID=1705394 RepID=A0A0M5LEI5_9GAMM|nr:type II secretion system F family protein [Candidatus Thioglobus autotrophicus]ALE52336.1 Type II Secretion system PilC [Candidatus Thioglobus autotrophicus]
MAAVYKYKGIQGNQYTDGKVEALNKDEAAFKLKEDKIIITSLERVSGEEVELDDGAGKKVKRIKKKVPIHEVIAFTKKLETMIRAGLPILETISMIEKQTINPTLKQVITQIHNDVESGTPLSDSFAKHSYVFNNVYINLLRAGESSGKVDLFLSKLVIGMEKDEKIRSSIKGALTYPIVLLVVAMAVIILMMVFVVPVFQDMFKGVPGGLPATTQIVVDISEFMRNPMGGGLLAVVFMAISVSLSALVKSNYKIRRSWHKFILKLPLFGELIQKSALSKIAMIQGNLTAAGVPVIESLDIAATSNDNIIIKEAMIEVKKGVFSGEPLSVLFEKNPFIFPATFTAMTSVGERTGNMEEMFESIARYYEEEMDVTITQLTSMLEPIMIVFMGVTVGFILVAMYTPMFQMGQTL